MNVEKMLNLFKLFIDVVVLKCLYIKVTIMV